MGEKEKGRVERRLDHRRKSTEDVVPRRESRRRINESRFDVVISLIDFVVSSRTEPDDDVDDVPSFSALDVGGSNIVDLLCECEVKSKGERSPAIDALLCALEAERQYEVPESYSI